MPTAIQNAMPPYAQPGYLHYERIAWGVRTHEDLKRIWRSLILPRKPEQASTDTQRSRSTLGGTASSNDDIDPPQK